MLKRPRRGGIVVYFWSQGLFYAKQRELSFNSDDDDFCFGVFIVKYSLF